MVVVVLFYNDVGLCIETCLKHVYCEGHKHLKWHPRRTIVR